MKLWIARDENGCLYLYNKPPRLEKSYFFPQKGYDSFSLDSELFPEVTFYNSPQEVQLKLMEEIVSVAESTLKTFPRVNEFESGASYRR
jgi:hypothetical protein